MIKRRLGFAGILLAGLILVLYLTGGGKIFGRLGVSRCEKLWKESEEVMVEGEVYQKTRKEEKLILYLKKIQIREMGNGKAVADERMLVYLDEKGNGPEIGQRILVKGNVGFFDPAANPGNFDQKNYYKQQNIQAVLWKGKVLEKQVKKTSFREKLWQFRNRTADEICREMGKLRGGILCAVLLGDSFYTEEKVKELYRVAGIGHLLAISGLHISFFGNGLYRIFYFTGRCSGKSASWELCGDDWNECFGIAGVYHVSDPDGSRADRKGIRWIDGTWDCENWFASDKSVAAFYGRFPAFFCCGSRYLSDWFGK